MSKVHHVNQEQFSAEVFNSNVPVIVDFYATWCPPCRVLEPILERLADEFAGEVKFVKVDTDREPGLADEYEVASLPTLILIDEEGRNEGKYLGSRREGDIREHLQKWLASRKAISQ